MTITTQIWQLRFKKRINSCYFDTKFTSETVFVRCYLKLSLPVFLKRVLIFAQFHPHVSYRHVSYKKNGHFKRTWSLFTFNHCACTKH